MIKNNTLKALLSILLASSFTLCLGQSFITATLNVPGNAAVLSEGCPGPYELVIRRGVDNAEETFIVISGDGDAQIGVDYTLPPGSFPIDWGVDDSVSVIPITVINDAQIEGTESIIFEIAYQVGADFGLINLETAIVDDYSVEIESASDTIQWCRNVPYVLIANSLSDITWSPAEFFVDSVGTAATIRPFNSVWVYANVGPEECNAKDSVYFDLAIVEILNPDTVYICLNEGPVTLQGNLDGLAEDFEWIPSDSTLSGAGTLSPTANPTVTTTYILQSDIGVCIASDRVVVRVDSLPGDLHIDIAPLKPYYCAGEIVALFSPSFDSLQYPDIIFEWRPDEGTFLSGIDTFNAALQLQDTTLYIRKNINNACMSEDSILINVVPPGVPLSVTDTTLCPGEMFQVTVLSDQVTDPEWMPSEGLSCSQCLSPTVTVIGTPGSTQFYEFSGKILDCPVGASLNITIPDVQPITIEGDQTVCSGEMIPLTIGNPSGLSGFEWDVISGNANLSCTECINPVVTVNANEVITISVTANTTNPNFCGASGVIVLSPGQTLQFTADPFFACLGDTVTVSTGNENVFNLQWSVFNGDLTLSCMNCETPVVTVNSTGGQLRFFGETSLPGFCNVSGIVSVTPFDPDIAEIILTPNPAAGPIAQGSSVMAELSVVPAPNPVMWTVNGVTIPSTAISIEFNANEDVNEVIATFTNSHGCEQTVTFAFGTVPPSFKIPNAFTPDNGDEFNDNFKIIIMGDIEIVEFLVFNRWGQLVYEGPANDLQGWDGMFKNEPAASDTYVYSAKLRYPDGHTEIAKGDVALLR